MNCKINIDRFICFLIENKSDAKFILETCLRDQGLTYEDGEIIEIAPYFVPELDRWYKCFKTVKMVGSGNISYEKGKLYKCEEKNCITDEQGDKFHCWYSKYEREHELYKYFRPATEKEILRLAPLTDEQRAYIEEGLKNGSIIREKDLAYAGPKFKIGDWLVENEPNNYARFIQILEVVNVQGKERYRISRDIHNDEDIVECRFVKNNYHPFNIQDAKAGDVLIYEGYYNSIVLFHGIGLNGEGHINYYCKCDLANYDVNIQGDVAYMGDVEHCADKYHPATKDQRDMLFKAIKKAGYTWNQEELKLEKKRLFSKIRFDEPMTKDELIELRDDKGEKVLVPKKKFLEKVNEIRNEEDDYIWPKDMIDQMHNEIAAGTPKVEAELRKYFANIFPYLYNVDVEKMTRDYSSGLLHSGYVGPSYFDRQIAYKRGIEDMLKLIKEGGE